MPIPQILQQLNRSNLLQMLGPARQMMNMVRSAQNPQLVLNQLAMSNPQLKQAMDIVSQYGGDSWSAVRAVCEQNGIDLNEFMNTLKYT